MYRVKFSILNSETIKGSNIIINSTKESNLNTVRDFRLGEVKNNFCHTCNGTKNSGCNGHFGKLNLGNIVLVNPAFLNIINNVVLKHLCFFCGLIKNPMLYQLADDYFKAYELNNCKENQTSLNIKKQFNELLALKNNKCLNKNCNQTTYKAKISNKDYKIQIKFSNNGKPDTKIVPIEAIIKQIQNIYIPYIKLVTNNYSNDATFLNLFFRDHFYIPSNYIREPNFFENNTTNAFTTELNSMVELVKSGTNKSSLIQQLLVKIDNSKNINAYKKNTALITLDDQVNGTNKEGILRNSILARRLDNSARSVLGPETDINIGEVLIPSLIMDTLSVKIYYNRLSAKYIIDLFKNQNNPMYPKIIRIVSNPIGESVNPAKIMNIKAGNKLEFIHQLKYGDYIEIPKPDGSLITYARQPSLHKYNIASGIAYRTKNKTIKIPINVQSSQNGDNDGDENAMTNPTNTCANIELALIPYAKIIAKNASNNSVAYGLVQDQLINAYLLYRDTFSLNECINILGKYIYLLKEIKNEYTGKEILSFLIEDHITYLPYFNKGQISLNELTSNYLTSQNYNSIFNVYSQLTNSYKMVNLLDYMRYLSQRYGKFVSLFSVRISDSLSYNNLVNNKKLVVNLVDIINTNIENLIKDSQNNIIQSNSSRDIDYVKQQNINNLTSICLEEVSKDLEKEKTLGLNVTTMTEIGFKRTKNEMIKANYAMGQQNNFKQFGVAGKCQPFSLPGDISIGESGYISNSLLDGMTYNEYVMHVAQNSLPSIINVTCGTTEAGTLGKKIVKSSIDTIVNYEKAIVNYKNIILPSANFLKISGEDICRVNILKPYEPKNDEGSNVWLDLEKKIYAGIKQFLRYNNGKQIIDYFIFYINIEGEIGSYLNLKNNNVPGENKVLNIEEALTEITKFYNFLKSYYFYIIKTDFILHTLLTYLNPLRIKEVYDKDVTKGLFNHIITKIKYLLRYSLSPGQPIGSEYAHSIQETITQQTLSSFHTVTKGGVEVGNNLKVIKEYLSFGMKNKSNIITCYSKNYDKLVNIKNIFEYASLEQFKPTFKTIIDPEKNNGHYLLNIIIDRRILELKNIQTKQYFQIYHNVLTKMNFIDYYWLDIDIDEENIIIIIDVTFKEKFAENKYQFNAGLRIGVSKGKYINENLQILKMTTYNDDLILEDTYELSFYVDSISELAIIDTSDDELSLDIGIWYNYKTASIFHSKYNLINKMVEILGNNNLYLPVHLLVSIMFQYNKPTSLYSLKEPRSVIKNVTHGDNNAFINAAFLNKTDVCQDTYSNLVFNKKIPIGTGYYKVLLDINTFESLEYQEESITKENIISEQIMSFI